MLYYLYDLTCDWLYDRKLSGLPSSTSLPRLAAAALARHRRPAGRPVISSLSARRWRRGPD
jgi:hypothetical protein